MLPLWLQAKNVHTSAAYFDPRSREGKPITLAFLHLLVKTEKLDLAILSFLRSDGIKVWVALVCTFFDRHMQVVTECN